uniref:Protein maelstrom 1 n=3 Tax=Ceratitis capitata TaxID=7213 RepID=W8CE96_CERCA
MPKKQVKNGFMLFTIDWRSQYGKHLSISEATAEAGKIWGSMSVHERAPYNERAKQERVGSKSGRPSKLTCTGKSVEEVEREKKEADDEKSRMQRFIQMTVRNSVKNCQLETQSYFFIMVNYFVKSLKGNIYVPAEISVAEYSLKDGVCRKYHTFVNPGPKIYGLQYEAQHHSESTHKLPLPPNAKGEANMGLIYSNVLDFIRNQESGEYPPVYTFPEAKQIVESVLDFLKKDSPSNVDLRVYDIKFLFYILKEATCEMGEVPKPLNQHITDAFFERDSFEFNNGLACTYHEDIDKSKYCTQSCVTRWGFMFSDYMCRDIAIDLIPGRHAPIDYKLAATIVDPSPSTFADTDSHISVNSGSSYATKAISENKIYYDDQKTFVSSRSYTTACSSRIQNKDDFPSLGSGRKKHSTLVSSAPPKTIRTNVGYQRSMDEAFEDSVDDLNPWSSRSRNVPHEPDSSHFDINYTREETTDNEATSTVGYGRGRMRNNQSLSSNTTLFSGRGRLFQRFE